MDTSKLLIFGLDKLGMMFEMYTGDFEPGHWSRREGSRLHSAHWILGHLALSLHQAAGADPVPHELGSHFEFGSPEEEEPGTWPAPDVLIAEFGKALDSVKQLWSGYGEAEWNTEVKENRLGIRNWADGAMFTIEHAVYHVGQLGSLRRLHGLKGIV